MPDATAAQSVVPVNERLPRLAVAAFFLAYLAVGVAIHGDFGASWDEPLNRDLGLRTVSYAASRFSANPVPWTQASRGLIAEQGPFFEVILVGLERAFGLEDTRSILLMRHLATFLAFWSGAVAFYVLLRLRFADRAICVLGVAMLVLTPRLFAHSFYNSKDAVAAALFIVATMTMGLFLRTPAPARAGLHALACAAAISVRIVALILPALTLLLLLPRLVRGGAPQRRRAAAAAAIFAVLLPVLVVLFWPAAWEHPFGTVLDAVQLRVQHQFANRLSLYFGRFVPVDALPWHYLPVWIAITLPVSYVIFFLAGIWAIGTDLTRKRLASYENVLDLAFLTLFVVPVLAVIVRRPVLYDDWRHLYFLQPFLVAIALAGIARLATKPRVGTIVKAAAVLMVVHGLFILVRYHPYQNVYFSPLAGDDVERRFELDYWGLSFREGLQFVLRDQPEGIVRVSVSDYPGVVSSRFLERSQRDRLRLTRIEDASYFLSNHRQPDRYEEFYGRRYPCTDEVHAIRVAGATLLGVFKLRD
jgi:hypothetical protein